jgi:hypothetical protein
VSHSHYARPLVFGDQETDNCTECGDPILLVTQNDGKRIWRHLADELDDDHEIDL